MGEETKHLRRKRELKILKNGITFLIILISGVCFAQKSEDLVSSSLRIAGEYEKQKDFAGAEAAYRKAISMAPERLDIAYNLGNLYYNNDRPSLAISEYRKISPDLEDKVIKHKAFHNLGNSYMLQKDYKGAVEAYKNSLRNDPTDDETRYNLALAKQKLKESGGDTGENQNQKDLNKDQNGQENDQNNEGEDKQEPKDEKSDQKEEDKPGDKDKPNGQKPQKEKTENNKSDAQPVEGQLSPQQWKQILENLDAREQIIQEKINTRETKAPTNDKAKDW